MMLMYALANLPIDWHVDISTLLGAGSVVFAAGIVVQQLRSLQREVKSNKDALTSEVIAIKTKIEPLIERNVATLDDIQDLKVGFSRLTSGFETLAVLQSKLGAMDAETVRTRDRLHDLESHVRGLLENVRELLEWRKAIDQTRRSTDR